MRAVYCGDCGGLTSRKGNVRVCSSCGTRTATTISGRLSSRRSSPKPHNVPTRTPTKARIKDAFLKANPLPQVVCDFNYPEIGLRFTGGGAHGACLSCGNAREECECQKS